MALPNLTSIQSVVDAILLLYQPGRPPNEIQQIQDSLQSVQRSDEGWSIADLLLHNEDEKVRFFGALTYTVKINQTTAFNEFQARDILQKLVGWIKRSVSCNEGSLVLNKLNSTLVTFFLRRDVGWNYCIIDLMYTFYPSGDQATAEDNIGGTLDVTNFIPNLTSQQIHVTLEFATTLGDEADKADLKSALTHPCCEKMQLNVSHVVALIRFSLQKTEHKCQALRCFASWAKFADHAWVQHMECVQLLQTLIQPALEYLRSPHVLPAAVNAFREILDRAPRFLLKKNRSDISRVIRNDCGEDFFRLLEEQDFDANQFALFSLSFANECVADLAMHVQDEANDEILSLLHRFLHIPHFEDYGFLTQVVEFWVKFAECVIEEIPSYRGNIESPGKGARQTHLLQACEESLAKSRYPHSERVNGWDGEDYEEHNVLRYEVADLLRLSITLAPHWALTELSKLAVDALSGGVWVDLEASLWAITVLSEYVGLTAGEEVLALKVVMESPVFSVVLRADTQNTPGLKTTTIDLLGKYSKYFELYPEHLLGALRFLFECLKSSIETTTVAARSIAELCSACRGSLVKTNNELMEQYRALRNWPTVDSYAKEKIIGGLAAVVQNTTPEFDGLDTLLQFVEDDIKTAMEFRSNNDHEQGENYALCAMQCLLSIANGLRPPEHAPIDLEADNWISQHDRHSANQHRICSDIAKTVQLIPSGDIVDAACDIFKSGFRYRAGPFAFPPTLPIEFLCQTDVHTPHLESILSMGSSLLLATDPSREQTAQVLQHVGHLMQALEHPSKDPGIAESLVDLANNVLRYHEGILIPEIPSELLNLIFDFAMQSLGGADILPKRVAASFWTTLLKLPLPVLSPMIHQIGPPLATVFIAQITMQAARADLDDLIRPVRLLLTASPAAPSWFATAVQSDAVITEPAVRARLAEGGMGQRFLTQLRTAARTGGGRMLGRVIREFWAACRGTVAGLGRVGGAW